MPFFDKIFGQGKTAMLSAQEALRGRETPILVTPRPHAVLGSSLTGPWEKSTQVLYLAMGCFWGAEEIYWKMSGVISTAVGYMGGATPNPTYEEVCTSRTGHTETVMVAYDPAQVSTYNLLRVFWERHDPTQGFRQGNDVGTQYRSAVYWTTPEQGETVRQTASRYAEVLNAKGYDAITTDMQPAAEAGAFYLAEDYHQQYLSEAKNPEGYRCHATTGVPYPE